MPKNIINFVKTTQDEYYQAYTVYVNGQYLGELTSEWDLGERYWLFKFSKRKAEISFESIKEARNYFQNEYE